MKDTSKPLQPTSPTHPVQTRHQFLLLKERRFLPLFLTQFLGALNDNIYKNGLMIVFAYQSAKFGSYDGHHLISVSTGLFVVPFLLFSSIAGQLSDKFEKTMIVRIIKLCEILIMLIAGIGFMQESLHLMIAALVLLGLHSTFFGPIKYALLPLHLLEDELVGGNGMIETATFLAILLGTMIGGMIVSVEHWPLWILPTLGVVVACLGYITACYIPKAPPADPHLKIEWNILMSTYHLMRMVWVQPLLRWTIFGISWFWFFGAYMMACLPVLSHEFLGFNEEKVVILLASFSLGIGIGSLLCERLSRRRIELGMVFLGFIGFTVLPVSMYLLGQSTFGFVGWLIAFAMLGFFGGIFVVPLYALMQKSSPESMRSQVIAANNIYNSLFMCLASLLTLGFNTLHIQVVQQVFMIGLLNLFILLCSIRWTPDLLRSFLIWIRR